MVQGKGPNLKLANTKMQITCYNFGKRDIEQGTAEVREEPTKLQITVPIRIVQIIIHAQSGVMFQLTEILIGQKIGGKECEKNTQVNKKYAGVQENNISSNFGNTPSNYTNKQGNYVNRPKHWRKCMVDTGASVTLIQKRLVPDDMINEAGTRDIRLSGITGYLITAYRTNEVVVVLSTVEPHGYCRNDSLR